MEMRVAALSSFSPRPKYHRTAPEALVGAKRYRVFCIDSAAAADSTSAKKVVSITGATGFIGQRLVQKLVADANKVCVLTRSRAKAKSVFPDGKYPDLVVAKEGEWENCIRGSNAVVNLAGLPISTRWSPQVVTYKAAASLDRQIVLSDFRSTAFSFSQDLFKSSFKKTCG